MHDFTLHILDSLSFQGEFPLIFPGVTINTAKTLSRNLLSQNQELNDLYTFWNSATFNLARGLDFNRSFPQPPINVCIRHLDHEPFQYRIELVSIFESVPS